MNSEAKALPTASALADRDLRTSRETLAFMKDPIIHTWVNTMRADRTKYSYSYQFMKLLKQVNMTPSQFKQWIESNPTDAGIRIDSVLSAYKSTSSASVACRALLSFAKIYRVKDFTITVKISARRVRAKKRFTWDMAEKIINNTISPYRQMLQFMLHGALDEHTFVMINDNDPEIAKLNGGDVLESIREQMKNHKPYIVLDMPPRKIALDVYPILIPKIYVPDLPISTILYRNRGGMGITTKAIQNIWNRAAKKANIYWAGLGAHHMRVAFRTKCEDLGIPYIGEYMMGHGGDKYGYARAGLDENFMLNGPTGENGTRKGGLKKLWESSPIVDRLTVRAELQARDEELKALKGSVATATDLRELQELVISTIDSLRKKPYIDAGSPKEFSQPPFDENTEAKLKLLKERLANLG